jgi:hypothetical protein
MIRKKPALGLDPRVEAGLPTRSCSTKILERQSIQSEAIALQAGQSGALAIPTRDGAAKTPRFL